MDEVFEEPAGGEDACLCEEDEAPADDMQDPADDFGEGGFGYEAD